MDGHLPVASFICLLLSKRKVAGVLKETKLHAGYSPSNLKLQREATDRAMVVCTSIGLMWEWEFHQAAGIVLLSFSKPLLTVHSTF